jgi:hypothetical protein
MGVRVRGRQSVWQHEPILRSDNRSDWESIQGLPGGMPCFTGKSLSMHVAIRERV